MAPERFELLQQLGQVGAGQGLGLGGGRLALQFGRMEDQAEAVDLFAAFAIDLLQPLPHQFGEVLAAQQGADQGADRGQGGAHLMGEGFEQGQLAAGAAPALVAAGPAMHQGLERHARGHGG